MAEFVYFAEALDGKNESKKGILTEKQKATLATSKIWYGSSTYRTP